MENMRNKFSKKKLKSLIEPKMSRNKLNVIILFEYFFEKCLGTGKNEFTHWKYLKNLKKRHINIFGEKTSIWASAIFWQEPVPKKNWLAQAYDALNSVKPVENKPVSSLL